MNSYYSNDNDDMPPVIYKLSREDSNGVQSIIQPEDPFNKEFEEEYDWEQEGSRLHSLNILQLAEYKTRQRKLMSYLERNLGSLPGFKIEVNKLREWCKVYIYRISDPYYLWIPKDPNVKIEQVELVLQQIPGQCGIDEFEIGLKDMHTLNVEISHISDHNGKDMFDEIVDDYPTITLSSPYNVVSVLLEFQSNGNL